MANESIVRIGADVGGLQQGLQQGERSLQQFGQTAERTGSRAASSLNRSGAAATRNAQAQERSARSIERTLQRQIALLEAGERGSRQYYESLARQRGIDAARFEPLLQQLDRARELTSQNTISVGQYNAALRTVPAQMTDIATQLAGGQNPFLIMLQQGGQLRDSFGGFGNMFRGIASTISPFKVAVGGGAIAVGSLAYAMYQGGKESRAYQNAITLAGDTAGITAGQLERVAETVGRSTGQWGEAREAALEFSKIGNIAAADYARFGESVTLMSEATGRSVEDLVGEYKKIGDDPVKAVVELSGKYKSMTAEVYAQAAALKEQGREQEAVRLIQQKYADESAEMAKKVTENLGLIESGWKKIGNAMSWVWQEMKSIGAEQTLEKQLILLDNQIKAEESSPFPNQSLLGRLYQQRAETARQKERADIAAERKQQRAQAEKDGVTAMDALRRGAEAALPAVQKLRKELSVVDDNLAKVRATGNQQAIAQAEANAKIQKADIHARLAEAETRAKKSADRAAKERRQNQFTVNRAVMGQAAQYGYADLEKRYGLPKGLLAALSMQESRGDIHAVSSVGARGTMQFMPATAKRFGVNVKDPRSSAEGAAKYMRLLLERYHGNLSHALSAYHSGEGNIDNMLKGRWQLGKVGRDYAPQVMARMRWLNGGGKYDTDDVRSEYIALGEIKKSDYERYQETFDASAARRAREVALKTANPRGEYAHELALMGKREFSGWTDEQQQSAMAQARAADQQEAAYKRQLAVAELHLQYSEQEAQVLARRTLAQANFNRTYDEQLKLISNPMFKQFTDEEKESLMIEAKAADARSHQFQADEKYGKLIDDLAEKTLQGYHQKQFELSLTGKTTQEIERLTLAREYDLKIMKAIADGASEDVVKGLRQQKTAALDAAAALAELQKQYDANWQDGIVDGAKNYMSSFKTMREEVTGLVEDSAKRMQGALEDFVVTGKMDFRGFTKSVLEDIARMTTRMAVLNAMRYAGSAMQGKGGFLGAVGNIFANQGTSAGSSAIDALFSSGGYTGDGGKYEPAGIVHKGEYVLSQENVRRLGGVPAIEGLLHRAKGYANGGAVGVPPSPALFRQPAAAAGVQVAVTVHVHGGGENAETNARKGVEAAIPKLVETLVKQGIAGECRPGGVIYQTVKA